MEGPNNNNTTTYQSVSDAYAGKSVFVTGGTGFVGKVIIEKLLYDCPKISKIYMLIRQSAKYSIDERFRNMLALPLFNRLRAERPQDLDKIVPVSGDVVLPKLGLKPQDEEALVNDVAFVFHVAATVKFIEVLHKSLKINFIGTKNVLELCHRMSNIKALIHVSTAYSNPSLETVKEILYPPMISLEEAELLAKRSCISDEETEKYLAANGSFNTYTFTKGLAEHYVEKYRGNLPTAIVRPSIVFSSKVDPFEGWVDSWSGVSRALLSITEGYDRTMLTNSNHYIDLIPVDYVANTIIVAAAKLNCRDKIEVYNICSSSKNPITMGKFLSQSRKISVNYKWNKVPFPTIILSESKWIVKGIELFQKLCAILADSALYVAGKEPRHVKHQEMIVKTKTASELFTKRTWDIRADNTCTLYESLNETDRKCFDFNPSNIVWSNLLLSNMKGIQKYLCKNDID